MSVLPELARRIIRRTGGPIFKGYGAVSADFSVSQTLWHLGPHNKLYGTLGPTTNSVPEVAALHPHILVHLTLHSLAILARDPKQGNLTG
jgi:hypothetical protein